MTTSSLSWRRAAWVLRAAIVTALTPVYALSIAVGVPLVVGHPADEVLVALLGGKQGGAAAIWLTVGVVGCLSVFCVGWWRIGLDAHRAWRGWVGPWPRQ